MEKKTSFQSANSSLLEAERIIVKTINLIKKQHKAEFDTKYQIIALIGEGGFGQVFKVRHIPSGKFYAAKTISWALLEDKATSLAEIEAMKQLDHPNLIKLYEYFEMDDAKVMLIMEYLSGENLYERILEHELFDEEYARKMFE
jgi:calcium-dependent protein kinase